MAHLKKDIVQQLPLKKTAALYIIAMPKPLSNTGCAIFYGTNSLGMYLKT